MKKIYALIIALILSFTLFGCKKVKTYETPKLESYTVTKDALDNLIIFIGDGMGPEQINAAELAYDVTYDFTTWKHSYSNTYSWNSFAGEAGEITDSAAGGTAIATGKVTINSYVGKDADGNDLATILDYAKAMGKSIGVVSTDTIYGATPSDFSSHVLDRSLTEEIITGQIHSNVDLFITEYSTAADDRKEDIKAGGYTYFESFEDISNLNKEKKVWCNFHFEESGGEQTLAQATEMAVNFLSQNKKGYVLMVEAAHIDKNAHNASFEPMIKAVASLNKAIEYAKSISNNNTGIIITADHETGSLHVSKETEYPSMYNDEVYYSFLSGSHSGKHVPVYIYGFDINFKDFSMFDSEELVKNSDIFKIEMYVITGSK